MSAYEMMYRQYIPRLSDTNVFYIISEEYRDVYIKLFKIILRMSLKLEILKNLNFHPKSGMLI